MLLSQSAHKYFTQVFPKYDDLNASVQENVSAIRVVKAYVREDFEKGPFQKASENIYKMFVKAEGVIVFNNPVMMAAVYNLHHPDQLDRCQNDRVNSLTTVN